LASQNKEQAMTKRSSTKSTGTRSGSTRTTGRAARSAKTRSRENTRQDDSARTRKSAFHEPSGPGREVGGKGDFGIPASAARGPIKAGGRGKDRDQGTGSTRGGVDSRETGVGAPTGSPGAGSGGDLDTDIVGLDGRALAKAAVDRNRGPDMTEQGGAPFASGRPARGQNAKPRGKVGGSRRVTGGDTVDHSGGDVTTSGQFLDDPGD
jgi:hypothetical protein